MKEPGKRKSEEVLLNDKGRKAVYPDLPKAVYSDLPKAVYSDLPKAVYFDLPKEVKKERGGGGGKIERNREIKKKNKKKKKKKRKNLDSLKFSAISAPRKDNQIVERSPQNRYQKQAVVLSPPHPHPHPHPHPIHWATFCF